MTGNQIKLIINPEAPLSELYDKVAHKKLMDPEEIRFISAGKSLIKHRNANYYQIVNDSVIHMMLKLPSYKFNVKLPDGRLEKTLINMHLKISVLKEKIQKEFGIAVDKQKLFYYCEGREEQLYDENYIGEYTALGAGPHKDDNYILVKVEN